METQNNELEVMRRQLAILNKKLEGQTIVNDRLIREAVKGKMSWIRNLVWAEIIAVPFIVAVFFVMAVAWHLSYWLVGMIAVLLVASVTADYKINVIGKRAFMQDNLADTARRLVRMKRQRIINEVVMIPFVLVWVVWLLGDIYSSMPADGELHDVMKGGMVGGIIGIVIGSVVSFFLIRKMQKTNDDVIRQINELTNDDSPTAD